MAFATLRTFLADNTVIGLPLGIERVIGIYSIFMQNKPNFLETQMKINPVMTKHYEQKPPLHQAAKQTQFKPNQTRFQMELSNETKPVFEQEPTFPGQPRSYKH